MLTLAVGLTLIGFVLLVFALMAANFWLAVACIAVCVVGLVILLVDTIRANKRGRAGVDEEPLFTIRGRESATRAEPLIDDTDAASTGTRDQAAEPTDQPTETVGAVDDFTPAWDSGPATSGGLGSIVSPDAHGNAVGEAATGETAAAEDTGDAHDYLRSVTGSFPSATPTGATPSATPHSSTASGAFAAPAFDTPAFDPPWVETPSAEQSDDPDAAGYVGRRRRIEQSESLVVNTSDPTLPAMQFVYHDSADDEAADGTSEATRPDESASDDESDSR